LSEISKVALLHYSASPVVGGVEAVMDAHAREFIAAGYGVKVVCGRGSQAAVPDGVELALIPEMDSLHPRIREASTSLEQGQVPDNFDELKDQLIQKITPLLTDTQAWIVHNIFSKHFNLPLTAALAEMAEKNEAPACIAWCHDFTWTSPNSHSLVYPGYPWDLLRGLLPGVKYVTISEQRRHELAGLVSLAKEYQPEELEQPIAVIPSGVDPIEWFGFTPDAWEAAQQVSLLSGNPVMIMPVRITQAKNIEYAIYVVAELKRMGYAPRLVVTGPPDPHSEAAMAYYQGLIELRYKLGLAKEICFLYETGDNGSGRIFNQTDIAGLLRACDVMFMPSHREGFGMPVLEAGLLGLPVLCSSAVPAAVEIGGQDVFRFSPQASAEQVAQQLVDQVLASGPSRLRSKVRRKFLWQSIFTQHIEPLLRPENG
jgi:mannosylglucosylglycerate synthase